MANKMDKTKGEIEELCVQQAQLSKCVKRKVGAVLVSVNKCNKMTYLASGHNYNPDGSACELENGETKSTVVHAEIACIRAFLDLHEPIDAICPAGSELVMFVTHKPCDNCQAELNRCSIKAIVVESFMKFDNQKPRMSLVPASLGISCARALAYGAKKYKVGNWRTAETVEPYINAIMRHLDSWREGEETDPESGLSHLDHMAANLCFLIELKDLPKINLCK